MLITCRGAPIGTTVSVPSRRLAVGSAAAHPSLRRLPLRLKHRPAAGIGSGGGGDDCGSGSGGSAAALRGLVASPLYTVWLQGSVVVLLFALLDAAYSGDWSRIGAISPEQETQLQQV